MTDVFGFLNAINNTKENLIIDEQSEKEFPTFMVLRGLSYFSDTVLQANEMNKYPDLSKQMINDFLLNSIRKKKRFSKWTKKTTTEELELVSTFYDVSKQKAESMLSLLTNEQLTYLKEQMDYGGRNKHGKQT